MTYNEIRKKYQNHKYINNVFVDPYAMLISPIFTKIFLKFGIIPNDVTILMIITGIFGAVFFCIPNFICKLIGIVFIHVWYILDCSDGEVARITKKFSKFGTEIDYTAHIINHPLFNFSFALSMIYMNKYNNVFISILFLIIISLNLINRNICCFYFIYDIKFNNNNNNNKLDVGIKFKTLIGYIIRIFTQYPNFALIFPIIYLIDLYFNTNITLIYLLLWCLFSIIVVSRNLIVWILKIRNK